MATTPTAPVSAPVSAPSTPSSSPVSAPVSAPVSTPVAVPTPVSTPETPVIPVSTPAAVEAPSVAAPVTKGPEPKQSDFPGNIEGFLAAHHAWDREEGEAPAEVVSEPLAEEAKPANTETTDAEKKPEVEAEVSPEPEAVTPEVVSKWLEKDPALKAALEASPEVKRQVFAMARVNAKLAPLGEIYPNVESARFANEKSNRYVGLRSGLMNAADNPEMFPSAMEQFASEFMLHDKDGNPVKDAAGNPTYGKDFQMLKDHYVNSDLDADIAAYTKLVETSDDDNDNIALSALKFVKDLKERRGKGPQAPDPSTLTPQQLAWQQQKEAELAARGEKLQGDTQKQTATEKKAERTAYTTAVNRKVGSAVGKRMDAFVAEKAAQNVFLPSYVTDVKDADGTSTFARQIFNEFNKKVSSVAYIQDHLAMLERMPPSPDAEKQRVDYNLQLIDDFMPDIMEAHLRQIQRQDIADRAKRTGNFDKRKEVAQAEPTGGSAVQTKIPSEEDAMAQAYKNVDATHPDVDRTKRLELALIEKRRLTFAH